MKEANGSCTSVTVTVTVILSLLTEIYESYFFDKKKSLFHLKVFEVTAQHQEADGHRSWWMWRHAHIVRQEGE